MADTENAIPPSKKRVAGRELTRDTPVDDGDDECTPEVEVGTFKRASDEVLASRRIVKVRRQQTDSAPSSNPFAEIRLVAPTESNANPATAGTHVAGAGDASKDSDVKIEDSEKPKDKEDKQPEGETHETEDKSAANKDAAEESSADKEHIAEEKNNDQKPDLNDDRIRDGKKSESADTEEDTADKEDANDADKENANANDADKENANANDADKENANANDADKENANANDADKENANANDADKENANANDADKENANANDADKEQQKGDYDAENDDTKDGKVEGEELSTEGGTFKSFQQLSSSQNAFTGLAGTGFTTSFGPNAGPVFGSGSGPVFGQKNDKPFGMGLFNNGSFSFGASGSSLIPKSEGSGLALQEVPVETGEENEKVVFNADSVLFEFTDGSWKERGKGELKVNVNSGTEKARILMRARGNYRLILNARLYPDMKLTNMEKKGVSFACINSATEGKHCLSTFALKFKDGSIAEEFKSATMEHKGDASTNTSKNSPKASV